MLFHARRRRFGGSIGVLAEYCGEVAEIRRVLLSGYREFLSGIDPVGVAQYAAIRFEDLCVVIGITVELFADFRERVSRLNGVGAYAALRRLRRRLGTRVH